MEHFDDMGEAAADGTDDSELTAAEVILRSLRAYDVEYVFGNFGTDHPPLLEAAARLREEEPDAIPEFVLCPHESGALSAAAGYAAVTGRPQAVFVHVDVGTQNLGAMVHNVHRGDVPVFIFAGLAPITHGDEPGARSSGIQYIQDVYDQEAILEQYCRWTGEYRPPADPDEFVARALTLASTPRQGPSYLTATREALETTVDATPGSHSVASARPSAADEATVDRLASMVREADAPLVVTSKLGANRPAESVDRLVRFAEAAGAGVVEQRPTALNFPRTHDLHVGFAPREAMDAADLVVIADADVPWEPGSEPPVGSDVTVVHVDVDPEKRHYPLWDFEIDLPIRADPAATLAAVAERLDAETGRGGADGAADTGARATPWRRRHDERLSERADSLADAREAGALTPAALTAAIDEVLDDSAIVLNETTTNKRTVLEHLDLDRPGSYRSPYGSGLGWAPGAATGVKLAAPDHTVVTLVGDGSYVFANPTASAWMAAAHDAPSLTVVYNNSRWNAVRTSTLDQHPEGSAAAADVPESKFEPTMDLSHAARVVDAHTAVVDSLASLETDLRNALDAVERGTPAVLDVRVEQ
ncbi:thiamine pyrophosphate-requiring protein [Halobellus rufus]|uniref:thiamine pyrophosphate-requiring protein n=1 Tax=Halobellus rufus TaxID=1448860 RepID=UPI000A730AF6|nr:thiamine pyrophosphate-requiring protein [Halobellus rufus]